ncbi:hypothetical protein HHI36_012930 [Cryptolaemus montrouzieri]|uniref:Uncharacterized protein n=1 Tax=Cryptolaemus montrouzieri TaxID=559131 RepID=A0ABD2NFN9_9CUCU
MNYKERGIPLTKHKFYTECTTKSNCIDQEAFSKYKTRLEELANQKQKRLVTPEMIKEMKLSRLSLARNNERFSLPRVDYPNIMAYNEGTIPEPWVYKTH